MTLLTTWCFEPVSYQFTSGMLIGALLMAVLAVAVLIARDQRRGR